MEIYLVQTVGRILLEKQVENEGALWKRRRGVQTKASYNGGGRTKTSGQETVERMSLLSDAGENNRVKTPWKRCRKQSTELFLEERPDG